MACSISRAMYCILQLIAFLLVLVGTPIDQFRLIAENLFGNTQCLTFWGEKSKCYSTKYDIRTNELWERCKDRRVRFQAAEALSIVTIALFLIAALFGIARLCCCLCLRWFCLVLNLVGLLTAGFCWACMLSEYFTGHGECARLKDTCKLGAGFALFATGWVLCLINIFFLMVAN